MDFQIPEENANTEEKRLFRRVSCSQPVHFQFKDPSRFGGCLSRDLSEGGIQINLNDFVPLGTELILQIQLAPEKAVECVGRVVWVRGLPLMDRYQAGLEFLQSGFLWDSRKEIRGLMQSQV